MAVATAAVALLLCSGWIALGSGIRNAHGTDTHLTVARVRAVFSRVGLPLRQVRVSPKLPGEVDLVNVNKSFSLTVTVFAKNAQARQDLRELGPLWRHNGWPTRVTQNVLVGIQPAGTKTGHRAPMPPMPAPVLKALDILRN